MKVLITGGSGRVGRYTVMAMAEAGHQVCSVDRVSCNSHPSGVRQIIGDFTDAGEIYDAVSRFQPDAVCHIAAIPDPTGFTSQSTFQNNVMSTFNVFMAAGNLGVKRVVYASSEMATGWLTTDKLPPRFPFNEDDRVASSSPYALSKFVGEVIAESMVMRFPEMPVLSLRINNVIMPDWYGRLKERREDFMNKGFSNFWSYVDVRDVASAFVACLKESRDDGEPVAGHEPFLVAAADNCLDIPLQEAVEKRYGQKGVFEKDFAPSQSAFDCRKIQNWFGWEPLYSWKDAPDAQ